MLIGPSNADEWTRIRVGGVIYSIAKTNIVISGPESKYPAKEAAAVAFVDNMISASGYHVYIHIHRASCLPRSGIVIWIGKETEPPAMWHDFYGASYT